MTISLYINLIANYYVNLIDTEKLIINRDKLNFGGIKTCERPKLFRNIKDNEIENPPKKKKKIKRKILEKKFI